MLSLCFLISVITSDRRERDNLYLQYITRISPVIKNILKYFLEKEGFRTFIKTKKLRKCLVRPLDFKA